MKSILNKFKFWISADRIGPDMPLTHWLLFSRRLGQYLCRKKFKSIGADTSVRPGVYAIACSKIELGNNVTLRPGTMVHADPRVGGEGIIIEDDVLIGSSVHIYVDTHNFSDVSRPISEQGFLPSKEVVIRQGAWIGANAVILPGVTIGKNSVVGASSVVTKDIPDFCVAVGNPAKIIKELK
jgi:acetyltransferase-like isoleucine patch superfamily enzyme